MSLLDKFKKGAAKAGIQASSFLKEGSSRVQSSSQSFAQGFSLPGEADKAAKILASFLGLSPTPTQAQDQITHTEFFCFPKADPDHPESALNSIPKAVLQRARGTPFFPTPLRSPPDFSCSPRKALPSSRSSRPALFSPGKQALALSYRAYRTAPGLPHPASRQVVSAGVSRSARISRILSSFSTVKMRSVHSPSAETSPSVATSALPPAPLVPEGASKPVSHILHRCSRTPNPRVRP